MTNSLFSDSIPLNPIYDTVVSKVSNEVNHLYFYASYNGIHDAIRFENLLIDGESNTFTDGLSRYPISTSLNIPKAEVQLFEKRSLLPMSIPLVGTPEYEEIDSQNKRMFSTTKYYASEDKLLRVPKLIVTILDKYDDYQINPLTRFPQPLHDNLMNTYKLCKLNQQIKELDFDNHQIIKHRGRIWSPQDNYEHILWLIWSNHIHLDQHYGINETERRVKVNHDFQNMHRIIQLVANSCKTCQITKQIIIQL